LGEVLLDQVPNPVGPIGHDENFLGPGQPQLHRLGLDLGTEINDIGIWRDGDDLFFDQHASPASVGRPVFEPVKDRAFDLLPIAACGRLPLLAAELSSPALPPCRRKSPLSVLDPSLRAATVIEFFRNCFRPILTHRV